MSLFPALRSLALPALLLLSGAVSTACAGQQGGILELTNRDDIKEGPGLLTGEEGVFTLTFGGDNEDTDAPGASESPPHEVSYQEFREFKRSGKTGHGDSGGADEEALMEEYQEFLKWKSWREYQERTNSREGMQ